MTDPRPLLSTGHFFPESRDRIREIFSGYGHPGGGLGDLRPAALLLPHGALMYCGTATVPLVRLLSKDFPGKIMLIGSVHREYEDTLRLPPYGGFETPFGPLPCDRVLALKLAKEIPCAVCSEIPFEEEACFDLILTSLRSYGFSGPILPVLAGSSSGTVKEAVIELLKKLVGEEGYFPILTANFRRSHLTGEEEALCGEALFESLTAYFSGYTFRWYHGSDRDYSAGFWESYSGKEAYI
jgi:AmmeMemoRadiSam system protein B